MKAKSAPPEVHPLLDEIAERLFSGHASIMVGAGFSRNASSDANAKRMPDWNQLADIFHERLHSRLPNEHEHYLNPLKVAEELQATFGRPTLENIISTEVPDREYKPGKLHEDLLALPWNDIFTTNYDTLIERAATQANRRFDLVLNQKDLVYSRRPRIIKLHGSFPSSKPFIITEEDYRRYPRDYALFVNTVQQSLIENTLCLIGFSGDDPNFLHWIGWIRDNLGSGHSPKIFLIGVFDLVASKVRLLEQKNITVVNLRDWCLGKEDRHQRALEYFFDYLKEKKKEESRLDWPASETQLPEISATTNDPEIAKKIQIATKIWRQSRLEYPGWIVCPRTNRQTLWRRTNRWLTKQALSTELPIEQDVFFWHELTWRISRTLLPLEVSFVPNILSVIERYAPFSNSEPIDKSTGKISPDTHPNLNWKEIREGWTHLALEMLRSYREDGDTKNWNLIFDKVNVFRKALPRNQLFALHYERSLFNLFSLDVPALRNSVLELEHYSSSAFDEVKRAGLLAELGNTGIAKTVLERALESIRSQLNLKPITSDYSLLSQEAYTLQLLKYVRDAQSIGSGSVENKINQEIFSRWNVLKQFKCDPWDELEGFRLRLNNPPKQVRSKAGAFDIGVRSSVHNLTQPDETFTCLSFLRFIEDVGVPLQIARMRFGKEAATGAIERAAEQSPHWATVTLLRLGDRNAVEHLFNRKSMSQMSSVKVNDLIVLCLNLLHATQNDLEGARKITDGNIGTHFASIIPQILSRLCTKASLGNLRKIFETLVTVHSYQNRRRYSDIADLTRRLVTAWPPSDYPYLLQAIVDNFYPPEHQQPNDTSFFPDPLQFVDIDPAKFYGPGISIADGTLNRLIEMATSSSKHLSEFASARLWFFNAASWLTEKQKEELAKRIWILAPGDLFPKIGSRSPIYFMGLPQPPGGDMAARFRAFVLEFNIPPIASKDGVSIGQRRTTHELASVFFLQKENMEWNSKDAVGFFEKIYLWWEAEKTQLNKIKRHGDFGVSNEISRRFTDVLQLLNESVVPWLDKDDVAAVLPKIKSLVLDASEKGLSTSQTRAALFVKQVDVSADSVDGIKREILSCNEAIAVHGFRSVTTILEANLNAPSFTLNELRSLAVESVKWRKYPSIIWGSNALRELAKKGMALGSFMPDLETGLRLSADETSTADETLKVSYEEKLEARVALCGLASAIHHSCEGMSTSVLIWKKISEDPDEFWEVRNQWEIAKIPN